MRSHAGFLPDVTRPWAVWACRHKSPADLRGSSTLNPQCSIQTGFISTWNVSNHTHCYNGNKLSRAMMHKNGDFSSYSCTSSPRHFGRPSAAGFEPLIICRCPPFACLSIFISSLFSLSSGAVIDSCFHVFRFSGVYLFGKRVVILLSSSSLFLTLWRATCSDSC